MLEVFAGSPDADRLTAEALALGQALDVGPGQLSDAAPDPGALPLLASGGHEAIAYFRESARLASQAGRQLR